MALTNRKLTYDRKTNYEFNNLFNIEEEAKLIKRALKREERQQKYKAKKEQYAKQKEEKAILEKAKLEEMHKQIKEMCNNLVAELLEESGKTNAVFAFEKLSAKIKKFKNLDEEFIKLLVSIDPRNNVSYYDYMFLLLTNENPQFFYLTPFEALTHGYTTPLLESKDARFHFSKVDREEMLKLQQFYIAKDKEYRLNVENYKSIFTDEFFQKNYLRYFPSFIGLLNSSTDISRALIIDPSKYLEISPENVRVLSYYLNRSPEVFKYLSKNDIESVAKYSGGKFGKLLIQMPEVAEKLDKNFFLNKQHPFKSVFGDITGAELVKYNEILSKFKGWNEYMEYKVKWINIGANRIVTKRKSKEEKLAEIKAQLEDTTPID